MEKTEIKPAIQGTKYVSWTLHKNTVLNVQGWSDGGVGGSGREWGERDDGGR